MGDGHIEITLFFLICIPPFLFYSVSFPSSNNFINAEGSHTLTEDFA